MARIKALILGENQECSCCEASAEYRGEDNLPYCKSCLPKPSVKKSTSERRSDQSLEYRRASRGW